MRSRAAASLPSDPVSQAPAARRADPAAPGSPANALTPDERDTVLAALRAPEDCDLAVAQVWARELDEGRYYCSI